MTSAEEVVSSHRPQKIVRVSRGYMEFVKDTTIMTWKEERDAVWQASIFRWHSMIMQWSTDVQIVKSLDACVGFTAQSQILVDIFYNKAPSTLMKRCRSLSRMANYFVDRGRIFPCHESDVYEFMRVERSQGAPPTRLKGYMEALTFARHVLGVVEFQDIIVSRRCQGVASIDVAHKTLQAFPLAVKHLEVLHGVLEHGEDSWDRLFCGMVLFCVYARARWSDAQHGELFTEDKDKKGELSFVEIATGVHKTAKSLQLKHQFLPLTAPCVGVVEQNWGLLWVSVRKELGVHNLATYPLMPAPDSQGMPTVRPLQSSEAGAWLRSLIDEQEKTGGKFQFTSHSFKCTCLSFCARRGIAFDDRLALGYHTQHVKMALAYSRDGASRPLAVLMKVLKEIRLGMFDPNDTRSGRLLGKLDDSNTCEPDSDAVFVEENVAIDDPAQDLLEQDVKAKEVHDQDCLSDHATTCSESESDPESVVKPAEYRRAIIANYSLDVR